MSLTLVVTNDFPPRQGGIQSYVHELVRRQPPGSVAVYASDYPGAAEFDARQPFPVVRHGTGLLLPTPHVRRRAAALAREFGASRAWFGASAPLGLLAPALRRAGVDRIVASTHGHETGWAVLPAARQVLRRIGNDADVITYISEYTRDGLRGAFGRRPKLVQLSPGVDVETFRPEIDGSPVRARLRLDDRPVVLCVSRLVRRKGQDRLIDALPAVQRFVPDALLVLVGSGKYEPDLRRRAADVGVAEHVRFVGGVDVAELPQFYAAADVFAMPCRTRRAGLDVEGLGIVYLEASATGLPVVAGRSGGAPEAVQEGETGFVVDGRDVTELADRLVTLLDDDGLRRRMGGAGRAWVEQRWSWDLIARQLTGLLDG